MSNYIIISSILINFPIIFFFNFLEKNINLFDQPDKIRKFQKKPIALYGGLILIYNLLIFYILNISSNLNLYSEIYFANSREYFSFFFGLSLCFIIGLLDDKHNISANTKLISNSIIIFIVLIIDENLIIRELSFSFLDAPIELKKFSLFFTLLCILLFLNAINMFDGINLQCSIYCLIIFIIFFYKNVFSNLSLVFIISLIFFIYLNSKNKTYLGDSGAQILGFVISFFFIKSYNLESTFTCDEIFIIMMLPGIDMFRLFLERLSNGFNPFRADNRHIHHLLINKIGYFKTLILLQGIIISQIFFYVLFNNNLIIIILFLILYSLLIFRFSKK